MASQCLLQPFITIIILAFRLHHKSIASQSGRFSLVIFPERDICRFLLFLLFSDQDKTLHYSVLEGACPIIVYLANHHRKKYIFKSLMKNFSKVKTLTFTLLFRGCQKNNDFKITNKTTTLLSLSEMHSISNKRDGNLPMHFSLMAKNVYVKTNV